MFWRRGRGNDGKKGILNGDVGSANAFYDVAMRRLDEQLQRNDALGTKASASVSVGTAVLPITFGLLQLKSGTMPQDAILLLWFAVIAFIVMMIAALAVLAPSKLHWRPRLKQLDGHAMTESEFKVRRWIARECVVSINDNESLLKRKARLVLVSLTFLGIETALLSFAALSVIM